MDKEQKILPEVIFHVVNSVKGGSGKSTLSFFLASYYESRPDCKAFVIDLDLRGTSWENNYRLFLDEEQRNKLVYVDQLIYDYENYSAQEIFTRIPVKYKSIPGEEYDLSFNQYNVVEVCMSRPEYKGDVDEVEADLYESAVYHIIKYILEKRSWKYTYNPNTKRISSDLKSGIRQIHIILDMPPSYEAHAEKIFKHLLLDRGSNLYYSGGIFEGYPPFKVELIALSLPSPAHIESNNQYLYHLFQNQKLSSNLNKFIEDGRFSIIYAINNIPNDLSAVITSDVISGLLVRFGRWPEIIWSSSNEKTNALFDEIKKYIIFNKHLALDSSQYYFMQSSPHGPVEITNDAFTLIHDGCFIKPRF